MQDLTDIWDLGVKDLGFGIFKDLKLGFDVKIWDFMFEDSEFGM